MRGNVTMSEFDRYYLDLDYKSDSLRKWTVDVIKDGKVVEYEYYSGDYGDVSDTKHDTEPDRQIDAYRSGVRTLPTVVHRLIEYGYAIVDNDGRPFLNEHHEDVRHVSRDISDMEELVDDLNRDWDFRDDNRAPYRVVRLLYQEMDNSNDLGSIQAGCRRATTQRE